VNQETRCPRCDSEDTMIKLNTPSPPFDGMPCQHKWHEWHSTPQPPAPEPEPNKCPSCGSRRKDSVGYVPSKEFGRIPCLDTWHIRDAAAPEPSVLVCVECGFPEYVVAHNPLSHETPFASGLAYHPFAPARGLITCNAQGQLDPTGQYVAAAPEQPVSAEPQSAQLPVLCKKCNHPISKHADICNKCWNSSRLESRIDHISTEDVRNCINGICHCWNRLSEELAALKEEKQKAAQEWLHLDAARTVLIDEVEALCSRIAELEKEK
jgi:hypothetical protein